MEEHPEIGVSGIDVVLLQGLLSRLLMPSPFHFSLPVGQCLLRLNFLHLDCHLLSFHVISYFPKATVSVCSAKTVQTFWAFGGERILLFLLA